MADLPALSATAALVLACAGCLSDPPALPADGSTGSSSAATSSDSGTTMMGDLTTASGTSGGPAQFVDLAGQPCVPEGSPIAQFISDGDTDVTCELLSGLGNGKLPSGYGLDGDCAVEGTPAEPRFGVWAAIVRVDRGDASQFVPFCARLDTIQAGEYQVDVVFGTNAWDNVNGDASTLLPATATFDGGPVALGTATDPSFAVRHQTVCPEHNTCDNLVGARFALTPSPFDVPAFADLITDFGDLVPNGFAHNMPLTGDAVDATLADRPWVTVAEFDYCLSSEAGNCSVDTGSIAGYDNFGSNLAYAVIMTPGP